MTVLQRLIKSNSPLRQLAIPLLCDLAHAGKIDRGLVWPNDGVAGDEARRHLWLNNGLSFYLEILQVRRPKALLSSSPGKQMKYWHHVALNCVAVWLSSSKDANSLEDVRLLLGSSCSSHLRCCCNLKPCKSSSRASLTATSALRATSSLPS